MVNFIVRHSLSPNVNEAVPTRAPHQLRVSRRTRKRIELILVIGILVVGFGLLIGGIKKMLETSHPTTSPDFRSGHGNLESTPEVRYATRGEWFEASGSWAKFGVLGAAFDGEKIVMSSAESAHGSLGCQIFPGERLMGGTCYEFGWTSSSKLPARRNCLWQIAVLEISQTTIRGARAFKTGESDPRCAEDYELRPSPFILQRPTGQPARQTE